MFNRKLLIILMLTIFILPSCNKDEKLSVLNQDNNTQQQNVKVDSTQEPIVTNSDEIEKIDTKQVDVTNNGNENNIQEERDNDKSKGELYENDKLGFSFVIPDSWSGKYVIKEENDGLYIYFKPSEPASEGEGLLFAILKKTAVDDEGTFDSVGEPRTFQAKGVMYITGGSTDIDFSESHKEFDNFIKMKEEVSNVVGTIKIID